MMMAPPLPVRPLLLAVAVLLSAVACSGERDLSDVDFQVGTFLPGGDVDLLGRWDLVCDNPSGHDSVTFFKDGLVVFGADDVNALPGTWSVNDDGLIEMEADPIITIGHVKPDRLRVHWHAPTVISLESTVYEGQEFCLRREG